MGPEYQLPKNHYIPPDPKKPVAVPPPPQTAQPMQPYQPYAQPENPYSFILDTNHKPKKSFPGIKSGGLRSRMLVILGGGTVLIFLVIVISKLALGGGSNNAQSLTLLGAEQQEIVRIADLGGQNAKDPAVQAFAETTRQTVLSQQTILLKYLTSKDVKFTKAELAAKKNTNTDKAFNDAVTSNQLDATLQTALKSSLNVYASDIKKNYAQASNSTSKQILSDSYKSVLVLLK